VMTGIHGRRLLLRPIEPSDVPDLHRIAMHPAVGPRWRNRGHLVTLHDFASTLEDGVLTQLVIAEAGNPTRALGLAAALSADLVSRHCSVGIVIDPERHGSLVGVEASVLFVDYLFSRFDFRKLYFESIAGSEEQYVSLIGPVLAEEGRLRDHLYCDGALHDQVILALERHEWANRSALVQAFLRTPGEVAL
jgi:aminoglycoside 6'-N-acetyltransferase